ncbi:LytR/AlgR family response regulator transcription factor [Flavilitoribacter nigricans]|uniref:DNA-binding response regulator n=1 Tax=Flavilitoribacter nigricans (strain ATCC 23147 / DSM 23189 / NBRC 102662 / NCIMB 1420 / SS-2) TaxID=1122177 RepID=A0A2D0N7K8_FLAN2|nr:LytTR family DNA-binding domain-containing protein [Flavilitoribacter nigricans]PHN04119.1 DNA-binding response regulator [Flavilitoribacter nigricans DSM 23189 = NBRC 102662]
MHCIAIDDEPKALTVIRKHAEQIPFLDLAATFVNVFEAQQYLEEHQVDLVFLDIQMPDISGMQWLRSLHQPPLVIFTTAFPQYAADSYELEAVDYLIKPFDLERFLRAVNKARSLSESSRQRPDFFFVKDGSRQVKLRIKEILYLEAAGNYVSIYTPGQKILVRQTLQSFSEQLAPYHFLRVHKSYLVNLQRIDSIEYQHIHIGASRIPVGKPYREGLQQAIDRFSH